VLFCAVYKYSYLLTYLLNHNTCFRFSLFSELNILQGTVATPLTCGGIFTTDFIVNLLVSMSVKNFENRLAFGEVTDKSLLFWCFWVHSV